MPPNPLNIGIDAGYRLSNKACPGVSGLYFLEIVFTQCPDTQQRAAMCHGSNEVLNIRTVCEAGQDRVPTVPSSRKPAEPKTTTVGVSVFSSGFVKNVKVFTLKRI